MNSQPSRLRRSNSFWTFALLAAALIGAGFLSSATPSKAAEDVPAAAAGSATKNSPEAVAARTVFAIGDKLRITFFERYSQSFDGSEGQILSSLVERTELTGDYVVQSDGLIFLPLLGPSMTATLSSSQLERALQARFREEFRGEVSVAIQLIEREPIYVAGDISQPGNFRHVPGMTVMHALALAGASDRVGADEWRQLDLTRERERLRQSESRLKGILARTIALSRSSGRDDLELMQQLEALAGSLGANRLSADAIAVRQLEMAALASQSETYVAILASLVDEHTIMKQSIQDAEAAMLDRAERVELLMQLRQRGATTDQNVHVGRTDHAKARSVWNELRASMARLERLVTEVEAQSRQKEIEADAVVASELNLLRASRLQEQTTLSVMAQTLVTLGSIAITEGTDSSLEFEIVRRSPQGIEHIAADSFTEMYPGDLLHIQPRHKARHTATL